MFQFKTIKQIVLVVGFYFLISSGAVMPIVDADEFFDSVHPISKTVFRSLKNDDSSTGTKNANQLSSEMWKDTASEQKVITPEMFGAIGDGKIHKLSTRYNTLESARKDFPEAKD